MNKVIFAVLLVALTALPALAADPVRMEVRVYYLDYDELTTRLGSLLGDLDICTEVKPDAGLPYLVINTDADQLTAIQSAGLKTEVTYKDIRDKFREMTGCSPDDGSFRDFGYFLTYWEMRDSVKHLAANYPDLMAIDSSQRSFQNRRFYIIKISDNPGAVENEPQVFFNGATHAREPMATHTCVAYATLLCTRYATDSMTRWLVDNREIFLSPVQNPDGYIYNSDSGGSSSNWRKNRNNTSPRTGPGVDLNRNYGYRWGLNGQGSSGSPGSETYRGPSRFSEPETQVIRDFQFAHKFRTIQDFHTYGRYNLLPWGYSTAWPAQGGDSLAWRAIADTMQANNGYSTGPTMRVLYETNGGSTDWAFADTLWNGTRKFISFGVSSECGISDFWYGSNNPSYVDNEVSSNIPNCYYLTRIAGVYLDPAGMVVNDTATGNADGQLDPGETANFWFKVRNRAVHPLDTAKMVTAVLYSSDSMVQIITPSADFPAIPRQTQLDNRTAQIQVECDEDAVPGTIVRLRLEVTYVDDGVTIMQPLNYQTTIGTHTGIAQGVRDYSRAALALKISPNPARFGTMLSATVPAADWARVSVYTEDGRLVRVLPVGTCGPTDLHWDRRDDVGRIVASGIYFVRLQTANGDIWASVTLAD